MGEYIQSPLFILLPGLDGSRELYEGFRSLMSRDLETITIGYPMDRYLNPDELVDYVEERIPEDRPVLLMGVSFSGPVAARLLARNNRNYAGGIFCTTFVTPPHPLLLKTARLLPLSLLFLCYRIVPLVRLLFFERRSGQDLIDLFQRVNRKLSPSVIARRVRATSRVDERDALQRIHIPCCRIQARNDRIVPAKTAEPFRRIASRSFPVFVVDGPHAILQCKPEECRDAVINFIASEVFPASDSR